MEYRPIVLDFYFLEIVNNFAKFAQILRADLRVHIWDNRKFDVNAV